LQAANPPEPWSVPALADWYCGGDESGDQVGHAVAPAGDIDGDGYGDVLVGAPYDRLDASREGVVSLFRGSPAGLPTTPDWQVGGGQQGSLFGAAVAGVGDVNGDGYDDVLVGAPGFNDGVNKKGAVFLYLGPLDGTATAPDWSFVGDQKDSLLGAAVASAGDVDGDGLDDFLIGAPGQSVAQTSEGAAFLFFGSDASISPVPEWSYYGGQPAAGLGTSVAGGGDVDGDGYDDVLVGAPGYGFYYEDEGTALLFFGTQDGLAASPGWQALGGQSDARFGTSVAGVGDVDADGYDDLLVGAPGYATGLLVHGAAFLFRGDDPLPASSPAWMSHADQLASGFGRAVTGAGDVNGDGYDDVAVGAYTYTNDQAAEGATFIYYGSPGGLSSRPGWQAEGDKADTEFGYALGLVVSLQGDGLASLLVGAPRYRQSTEPEGRALAFYGPLEPRHYLYLPLLRSEGP
jgi:hypothetical protein